MPIKVNRAQCRRCKQKITSKHVHDFQSCRCGTIFVDGGKEYLRRGYRNENDLIELSEYEVAKSEEREDARVEERVH